MLKDKILFDEQAVRWQLESYLALGFHPIPLHGKVANYPWKQFSLTQTGIRHYLNPKINWGLRTDRLDSGLWFYAIDIDKKDLLAIAYEHCPMLMDAPVVSTGNGFHIYLTWKEQVRTRYFAEVEIIGNGYVVAPPSIHPGTGKRYTFIKPLNVMPPTIDLVDIILEEWKVVLDSMVSKPRCKPAENDIPLSVNGYMPNGVPVGQRHNALVRYLGILYAQCFLEEEALSIITSWNKLNLPPLLQSEVNYTVRNCWESWDTFG